MWLIDRLQYLLPAEKISVSVLWFIVWWGGLWTLKWKQRAGLLKHYCKLIQVLSNIYYYTCGGHSSASPVLQEILKSMRRCIRPYWYFYPRNPCAKCQQMSQINSTNIKWHKLGISNLFRCFMVLLKRHSIDFCSRVMRLAQDWQLHPCFKETGVAVHNMRW